MSFTFLCISIPTWRGRWRTQPSHPHCNIISYTTQCLTHNYVRKGELHIFIHFNTNMEREMENTPYTYPTTLTYSRTPYNTIHFVSVGTWRWSIHNHPYHPPPPKLLTHNNIGKGVFHLFCISIPTWRGRWRTHPTPTLPPHPYHPHTQEHFTIQFILCQLEHGDGDGAYTPNPTTPPPLTTSQYDFFFSVTTLI